MKSKILNIGLLLTSLFGYLEWGGDHKMFLVQLELEVLSKLFKDPLSVIHPLIFLPLIGQLLLLYTLFQKRPSKVITLLGLGGIGSLLLLMFAIGLMGTSYKILISTLPFLIFAILTIIHHWKKRAPKSSANNTQK